MTFIIGRIAHFLRLLATRFIADGGLPNAASLSYTTLLSVVPLMTVALAAFTAFPVSEVVVDEIQDFVFYNFMPASGEVVQEYLRQFSIKASKLSGIGFGTLILVALMLMVTIDRAINDIWRARAKRSPLSKFMMYWAILTLGPLLIGLSVAATSYLVSMPILSDTADSLGVRHRLLSAMPLLAAVTAFSLIYVVVPNRKVPIHHGIAGGVLAAVLFELAKRGFAFYVTSFPTYQAIYGALAVVPLFLVWIYLCWVVTLLGAEFAYCLGIFRDESRHGASGEGGNLLLSYRLLKELWQLQWAGQSLSTGQLARRLGFVEEERLDWLLDQLKKARFVVYTDQEEWALSRDLSKTSFYDLYRARHFVLPNLALLESAEDPADRALLALLRVSKQQTKQTMEVPLEQLFLGEPASRCTGDEVTLHSSSSKEHAP